MEGTEDIEIDEMVTGGPAFDRIRGIFHSTPTSAPVHIDLIEKVPAATKPPRTRPKTRGGRKTMGGGLRGPKTRGFAFQGSRDKSSVGKGGIGRGGVGRGGLHINGAGRGDIVAPTSATAVGTDAAATSSGAKL